VPLTVLSFILSFTRQTYAEGLLAVLPFFERAPSRDPSSARGSEQANQVMSSGSVSRSSRVSVAVASERGGQKATRRSNDAASDIAAGMRKSCR